ncbi:MAG: hypothetical protein ABSF23_13650 [Terracidiphilus sp.]|jgi:hypothetical protein
MQPIERFIFRKHASIGAAAAEEDAKFLAECFVDTGDLEILLDCSDRRRIVLGRTGAGKSAILQRLIAETGAIVISPEALSFNYLTNSTILQFFLEAGVKLDLFFKLLWRHVFTVELLKNRYDLKTRTDTRTFLERIKSTFVRDPHKDRAIKYLLQWGDQFWEETEYRIREITHRIEENLKASLTSKIQAADLGVGAASKLTDEERAEVVQRGKSVIDSIQMRELTDVLTYLKEEVFSDAEQNYYICIDRLDENWVDDSFRYLLIRSLIETIRDFLQVQNIKIIAAIRTDLIERVFRNTRDAGFQEEKYRSLYLPLRWTNQQLCSLLDKRVNFLVRETYTKKPVGYTDVLPNRIEKTGDAARYLIVRTLMRPRDLIEFFNNVIEHAAGKPTLTREMVFQGEGLYSKNRLRSLQDEWISDFPTLVDSTSILKQRPNTFRLSTIPRDQVEDLCLMNSIADPGRNRTDVISVGSWAVVDGATPWTKFLCSLMHVFYTTGVVGLKTESFEAFQWAHEGPTTIVADTIGLETSAMIHPMFYRVLGIKPGAW